MVFHVGVTGFFEVSYRTVGILEVAKMALELDCWGTLVFVDVHLTNRRFTFISTHSYGVLPCLVVWNMFEFSVYWEFHNPN